LIKSLFTSIKIFFEFGQGDVALSRVKSWQGLRLRSFEEAAFKTNSKIQDLIPTLKLKFEVKTDQIDKIISKIVKKSNGEIMREIKVSFLKFVAISMFFYWPKIK